MTVDVYARVNAARKLRRTNHVRKSDAHRRVVEPRIEEPDEKLAAVARQWGLPPRVALMGLLRT